MKEVRSLLVVVTAMCVSNALAQTPAVPPLINYQGRLTDATGAGIDGTRNLTFNIYSNAVGASTAIWGPQTFSNVPLVNGHFNVILGTTDTVGRVILDAWGSKDRYLGIQVGDGTEIAPRQQVLSAPYAAQAERAQCAVHGVPPGTVVAYWGTNAPPGWLVCNGLPVPSGTQYDALRAIVGASVPDLRGMFLRGLNSGRSDGRQDPDGAARTVGSYQGDVFANHRHSISGGPRTGEEGNNPIVEQRRQTYRTAYTDYGDGGNETRSKNVAVNWIIKY